LLAIRGSGKPIATQAGLILLDREQDRSYKGNAPLGFDVGRGVLVPFTLYNRRRQLADDCSVTLTSPIPSSTGDTTVAGGMAVVAAP
jgi:hypothetical protein